MRLNKEETVHLVTFTEKTLNEKLHFLRSVNLFKVNVRIIVSEPLNVFTKNSILYV